MGSLSITKMLRHSRLALVGGAILALQGCGVIYKTTGDVLISFGRSEMLPYMLTYNDVRMACVTGEAQTPLLMAFERVGSHPEKLGCHGIHHRGGLLRTDCPGCRAALHARGKGRPGQ